MAYEKHLAVSAPGRRDLRFKPQTCLMNDLETFRKLPMGDLWDDAVLLDSLNYSVDSKRVRFDRFHEIRFERARIPGVWADAIYEFRDAYHSQER